MLQSMRSHRVGHNLVATEQQHAACIKYVTTQIGLVMLQEGGPLPGTETGLLSNTRK